MSKVILRKVGTDYIVNIPSDIVEQVGAKEGDILGFHINTERNIEIELQSDDVQKDALAVHELLMDEYNSAFERLAK